MSDIPKWYLLIIEDQFNLPGKDVKNILEIIKTEVNFKYVVMDNIEGAPIENKNWLEVKKHTDKVLKFDQILPLLLDVKQFEWGDFFLFKNQIASLIKEEEIPDYPRLISQSDTTVRAIDGHYIYIYTQDQKIIEIISKKYAIESIKKDVLVNLEHPFLILEMKLDTIVAYFHDGRIIDIKHHEDNLDIWMESSELETQWPTNFLLSKDNTIKGVLHFKGVDNIKINDKEISNKLKFSFDYGEILDLEIENNQNCTLNVIWKIFDPAKRLRQYESIKIKSKEIYWENLPNLEIP